MSLIFVDTGALFASIVPWDSNHGAAATWLRHNHQPLITTDYVIDETLTLLRARREGARALALGDQAFSQRLAQIHFLDESDIRAAWDVFRTFADKEWSFTDCTSKVIIDKLGIPTAFSFDQHFHQFGTVTIVP